MFRRSRGWLLSVSEALDAVSRVHVELAGSVPIVVVYMTSTVYAQYSAKRGLHSWTTDTSNLWTWQLRGPGLRTQVLGLAIDN